MSWYTTGEIFIWLLLAAVLGFILAWLIQWWRQTRKLRALREKNEILQNQLDACLGGAKLELVTTPPSKGN